MKIAEIKELKNSLIQSLTGKIEDAFDEILENHTNHILSEKMPSDEKIEKANPYPEPISNYQRGKAVGFVRGAKWFKQQLKQ